MYRDASYGENWQPTPNNIARRIDPYSRSCALLGCFFAVGFILTIIVVLSLIPVYISRSSSGKKSYVQVPRVYVNGYTLQFRSPSNSFNAEAILSHSNNLQALRAALTSMIQNNPTLTGSIVDISKSSLSSKKKRQELSDSYVFILDLNVTSGKPCTSILCLTQFQTHSINQLCDKNRTISTVRFEQPYTNEDASQSSSSSSSHIYWLNFRLPQIMKSNVSFTNVDLKTISSSLETLITLDKNLNHPSTTDIIISTSDTLTSTTTILTSTTTTLTSTTTTLTSTTMILTSTTDILTSTLIS
ncbi:unnamed protein product [Rotaria sp. Silwood1]|nr:unnamed protein product [Rotaria sp. Silwood1]CAF3326580.1 unnamed protein product [Rotaria sp. Silwood1]CAF3348056.1 unnamed protein product [Rotaria sp. Silwood1]CAF4546382.1 unnamed protein product [Rotaria sp. Silwood1]CAF4815519.1 unnamed protein product [Rotaria sp. Silwood1]